MQMKKIKALLLSLLSLSLLGGVTGCEMPDFLMAESSSSESSSSSSTPDNGSSSSSTSDDGSSSSSPTESSSTASSTPDDGGNSGDETPDYQLSDPATVIPAAYALQEDETLEGTYTLKGQIIESDGYNSKYGDISVTIVVEGYEESPIYCYQIKNDADKIGLGDYIVVQGTIKNYQGTVEFMRPTMLHYEDGTLAPAIDVTPSAGTGIADGYQVITVEQALAIAKVQDGTATTERYYIHATVATVTKAQYGAMIIEDETGSISVYGTYSEDGSTGYASMSEKPYKGDEVLLSCTLNNYKGNAEIQNARLIDFKRIELDESAYDEMTVEQAREAAAGTKVKTSGVVASITYANGMIPNGIFLFGNETSIYVYDVDLAARVEIGNTITLLAEKTWWILDKETESAEKFGYKGCNQLENAWLVSNDGQTGEVDYSFAEETTVKAIMDTPVSTDITTTVYKVNALVKKDVGADFVNYYIDDLDGVTGSYVYTQCNGSDLDWLEEFDGKICTVYLSVINAKSTATGCNWRFKALKVIDENFAFDVANAPQFVLDYHAAGQFQEKYNADPALALLPSVSSELLGFENVTISYSSDNTEIIYFEDVEGVTVMHCGTTYGTANITLTATYNGETKTKVIQITNEKPPIIDFITVAQAIEAELQSTVTVKGVVGPSLVNKVGFYLFGEDGSMIAVEMTSGEELVGVEIGQEVIIKGTRNRKFSETKEDFGQSNITSATLEQNNFGKHAYSLAKFTEATVDELATVDVTQDYTTKSYLVTCKVSVGTNTVVLQGENETLTLYASGVSAYAWLSDYTGNNTVTLEVALCNWNAKGYKGCVLAVHTDDGKILNTANFDKY